jgi:hypothetical protein
MAEPPAPSPTTIGALWKVLSTPWNIYALLDKVAKLSEDQKALTLRVDNISVQIAGLEGSFGQFTKVVDMVREDISRTDNNITGKVKNEVWAEVQQLTQLRQEVEEMLASLKAQLSENTKEE